MMAPQVQPQQQQLVVMGLACCHWVSKYGHDDDCVFWQNMRCAAEAVCAMFVVVSQPLFCCDHQVDDCHGLNPAGHLLAVYVQRKEAFNPYSIHLNHKYTVCVSAFVCEVVLLGCCRSPAATEADNSHGLTHSQPLIFNNTIACMCEYRALPQQSRRCCLRQL